MIAKTFQPPLDVRKSDEDLLSAAGSERAPSKTRRKAEMNERQTLGESLVDLDAIRIAELNLPEQLVEALRTARRITKHEARRRQMQFIGRLMRDVDPVPIRDRLREWADAPNAEKSRLHRVERWRERLLAEPRSLDTLCDERPEADRSRLATLIEEVHAERAHGEPPRAYRELYRSLNRLFSET
jgi:ribosome-associated protein